MKVDSQMCAPHVATQAQLSGVFDELSKLFAFVRETLSDFLELVSLETRRAGLGLVWMIVGGLVATTFIVTAWTGLMAALAIYIVSLGMLPLAGKRSHPLRFYAGTGIAGSGGSSMPLRAARMTEPR